MKSFYKVITILLLLLGIVHIAATPVFYPALSTDAVWFIGGGLVLLFAALINHANMTARASIKAMRTICNAINVIALAYTILIVMCLPEPQAMIAVLLLLCETAIGVAFKPGD